MTADLLEEYRALAALCDTLSPADWERVTPFYGWTPWDEIAHLLYFDETALVSVTDPERFAREATELSARTAAGGEEISARASKRYSALDGATLLARWRGAHGTLVETLAALDPKARLGWYGPSMSARSFATARLMETCAHGQDIWDAMRRRRPGSARLKHIAHLDVTTYAWTFVNRGLPVPDAAPFVALTAPDGSAWTWGDAASAHSISGEAQAYVPALEDEAVHVLEGWLDAKRKHPGEADDEPCRDALTHAEPLGLEGTLYRIGGEAAGFVLAESIRPGVMVMRFAKALDRYTGLYQYMFQQFCQARPALHWLNFAQDLASANFRRTKLSYQPAALLDKLRAVPR